MTTTTIPADPTPTHVRITVEGTARPFGTGDLLRVEYDSGVLLIDPEVDSVDVEYLPEPRMWADGDVVQHATAGWTLTRMRSSWVSSNPKAPRDHWTDELVTKHLTDRGNGWDHLRVLRYQAGE
jgi:hypothetical protein